MSTDHLHTPTSSSVSRRPARALWIAAAMTALIAAFFLLREHWGHVADYWPYLLLLACPVMHLFHGHGGHGRHDAVAGRSTNREADQASADRRAVAPSWTTIGIDLRLPPPLVARLGLTASPGQCSEKCGNAAMQCS